MSAANIDNKEDSPRSIGSKDAYKKICDEYKVWKKNTPFLYDFVMTHALEWPSLTIQFLPDKTSVEGKDYSIHRVVLGTHAVEEANYLMIARIQIPNNIAKFDYTNYDDDTKEYGGFGGSDGKFEIEMKMIHPGEVNKARYMPQNPSVIATKGPGCDVLIYDYSKHSSKPDINGKANPDLILTGHSKEGYGLCWNSEKAGLLLSCSDDKSICIWDINQTTKSTSNLQPYRIFNGHNSIVEDVAWSYVNGSLFASCGDDKVINLWDIRQNSKNSLKSTTGHNGEINCVTFCPTVENLLGSGSSDKNAFLWDLRCLSEPIHKLEGHDGEIYHIHWSPREESILSTAGTDRRVCIWDLSKIGSEQTPEDKLDGPPELLFIHGGHTSKVSDISWNLNEPWMLASVAEDNVIQFWQIADVLYTDELE